MGLFDSIAGQVLGSLGGGQGTAPGMMGAIGSLLEQSGGLQGLVDRFHAGGLGATVDSWVGTGSNLPISAGQLQSVLGSDAVRKIATQLGLSPDAVSQHLADILPRVVDHATPNGTVPDEQALGSLVDRLKNLAG